MSRPAMLLSGLLAVVVVAVWWLFLYSPGQDELARIEDDIAAAEAESASLRSRVAQLEAVRARAPETEAAIVNLRSVVPDDPALAGALRQIEAAAEDAGMEILALGTPRPTQVEDLDTDIHSIAVSLNAVGSYFQTVDFLRRLEDPTITARGLTFQGLTIAPLEYPTLTVTLTGTMYAKLEPVPEPPTDEPAETAETPAPGATETPDPAATATEGPDEGGADDATADEEAA